jgi:hypothetical protein
MLLLKKKKFMYINIVIMLSALNLHVGCKIHLSVSSHM